MLSVPWPCPSLGGLHPFSHCDAPGADISRSERRGCAGDLLTPGEPALCKGMAVMAGKRMWCGLCWTLPPPHHTARVSKVQTGPLALGLLHLTAQPGASIEAQTRSEHVGRTVEMVKGPEMPITLQKQKGRRTGSSSVSLHQ